MSGCEHIDIALATVVSWSIVCHKYTYIQNILWCHIIQTIHSTMITANKRRVYCTWRPNTTEIILYSSGHSAGTIS